MSQLLYLISKVFALFAFASVKMRGFSSMPHLDAGTFIILDRLYGTLDDRIERWEQLTAVAKGCCGLSDKSPQMIEVLKDRLLVAFDLSSAFIYLHDARYVYYWVCNLVLIKGSEVAAAEWAAEWAKSELYCRVANIVASVP